MKSNLKKVLIVIFILTTLLLSGCNSFSDFVKELKGNEPYISELKSDRVFYTYGDDELKILVKIKNPTKYEYTPKIKVDYPEGVSPVDYQLKNNDFMDLVKLTKDEEKSYFIIFRFNNQASAGMLDFNFSIYNKNENYEFDKDPISIEYSSND